MKNKKILAVVLITVLLCLCVIPVNAQIPKIPASFYGGVLIHCAAAPAGTTIEAQGAGVLTGVAGNPIVTTEDGQYGASDSSATRLIVQGDIAEGAEISFYINGILADQTAIWSEGTTMELDLSLNKLDLTVQSSANGTVSDPGTGTFTYMCGDVVTLVAQPNSACYYFVNWTGDAVADPDSATTTILMDDDKTVTANFAQYEYTLTVTADPALYGLVTGSGTYPCGTDVQITATATGPCYYFTGWTGTGIAEPSSATTTVNIDGDKTVTANFAIYEYVLTVAADPAEFGEVTGGGTYACGSEVAISTTPTDPNYHFIGWTGAGIADPSSPDTTVIIDGNKTVTANYIEYLEIELCAGWNTFGTPMALADFCDTWGEFIVYNGLPVNPDTMSFYFDASAQIWKIATADYQLNPCESLYVNLLEPATVIIMPSANPSISATAMYPGWNLISLASFTDMAAKDALTSIYNVTGDLTGYVQVISPPLCQESWLYIRDGEISPMMEIGKGYWVFMINGGTLAGFTFTPF